LNYVLECCFRCCSFFMLRQVLRVRIDILRDFRCRHGQRIKKDTSGSSSVATSLEVRVAWAAGEWVEADNGVMSFFTAGPDTFHKWGILQNRSGQIGRACQDGRGGGQPGSLGGQDCPEAPEVDQFMLETFETLARNFVGLHTRTFSLWSGGVYNLAQLLSPYPHCQAAARKRAVDLWPRVLRFEELCNAARVPSAVLHFQSQFLWLSSTVWREMLSLVSAGRLEDAKEYAWRIHGGVYHEKGTLVATNIPPLPCKKPRLLYFVFFEERIKKPDLWV
jgi:hypothetical protein